MEDPSPLPGRDVAKNETSTASLGRSQVVRLAICGFLKVVRLACCGFLMGVADVIPGVSGGTVALMLGIYRRLVTAISHFDLKLWSYVKRKQWRAALAHVDFLFLVSLGIGILLGIVTLGGLMNELLSNSFSRPYALSALFGLIAASAVFVAKLVSRSAPTHRRLLLPAGILGALFAAWLTQLTTVSSNPEPPYVYVFLCGAIAICAMILPGISGAYLLLILGLYGHITGIVRDLPFGQVTAVDLMTLAVFATGCAVGLVSFSKLLRWLLQNYQNITMSVPCGFMVGALSKVWPFQKDLAPEETKLSHKHFENIMPDFSVESGLCLVIAVALFLAPLL